MSKIRENKLKLFGHVMRKDDSKVVIVVMGMNVLVEIERSRGRPKKMRIDIIDQ